MAVAAAALPSGINSYLIAVQFGTGQALASNQMTIATACAVVTTAFWLSVAADGVRLKLSRRFRRRCLAVVIDPGYAGASMRAPRLRQAEQCQRPRGHSRVEAHDNQPAPRAPEGDETMLQKTSHFMREANLIDGEWVQADSGATIDVINPATGLKIGTVPKSGKAETRRAIEAADAAFQTWRKTSVLERSKLLRKLHDAIMDNQQPLAELLTTEQGKSLAESKGEIAISAGLRAVVRRGRRAAPMATSCRRRGRTAASWSPRSRSASSPRSRRGISRPRCWRARSAPALAAGCTAVVKPASQTPYSGLAWGVLCEEVGFPKGVVNIVTGSAGEIGDEICANPLVRKITFTGSTEVGKMLMAKCGGDREEGVDGARRQRAVHRLRRRRHRPRGRRRDGRQVPQFRPDLRLHQPLLRAGRHL